MSIFSSVEPGFLKSQNSSFQSWLIAPQKDRNVWFITINSTILLGFYHLPSFWEAVGAGEVAFLPRTTLLSSSSRVVMVKWSGKRLAFHPKPLQPPYSYAAFPALIIFDHRSIWKKYHGIHSTFFSEKITVVHIFSKCWPESGSAPLKLYQGSERETTTKRFGTSS